MISLRIVLVFCIAFVLCKQVTAQTVSVSVAGVTIDKDTAERIGGVRLQLAIKKEEGGVLDEDRTGTEHNAEGIGVFNLSHRGIDRDLNSVWVVCHDDRYVAKPLLVRLEEEEDGVRRSKARDIVIAVRAPQDLTADEAGWQLAAAHETQGLFVQLGFKSKEEAQKDLLVESAYIADRFRPGSNRFLSAINWSFEDANKDILGKEEFLLFKPEELRAKIVDPVIREQAVQRFERER